MGIQEDVIQFERAPWNEQAERALDSLIEPEIKRDFISDIQAGRSILWKVTGPDWLTWLVTRVEDYGSSIEMVLEVIEGSHAREIVAQLKERARALGVDSIRFETHHPEAVAGRLVGGLGFKRAASIFRVNL